MPHFRREQRTLQTTFARASVLEGRQGRGLGVGRGEGGGGKGVMWGGGVGRELKFGRGRGLTMGIQKPVERYSVSFCSWGKKSGMKG